MDIPNTLTLQQLILMMSLFTLLIGWLIVFAYLALRPTSEKPAEQKEHTATLPATKTPVIQMFPVTPRAPSVHTITQTVPIVTVSTESKREVVLDHSSH